MTPQADGTFIFETESTANTFAYQILGAEKTGHSVNGTQADEFAYDNGGDYRYEAYLNEALEKHPNRNLRANILSTKLGDAAQQGDTAMATRTPFWQQKWIYAANNWRKRWRACWRKRRMGAPSSNNRI